MKSPETYEEVPGIGRIYTFGPIKIYVKTERIPVTWELYLPHSCDEWMIGSDITAVENFSQALREAIRFVRTLPASSCSLCDDVREEDRLDGRIPPCPRPPTKKVRDYVASGVMGGVMILDVCDHHARQMGPEAFPKDPTPLSLSELDSYIETRQTEDMVCRGCGEVLVHSRKDKDFFSEVTKGAGLDAMVIKDHLDYCIWRKKA